MPELEWSDLRHALAVGETGSLAGASRLLGVNHTTVLRRLDALEAKLGTRLFERRRSGYEPTDAGQTVLAHARHMADRVDEIERQILGRDRELTGLLQVTTAFVIMEHLLPAPLADFARAYPGIEVEVTPHTLRHTFAVNMLSMLIREQIGSVFDPQDQHGAAYRRILGDPLQKLQHLLGHASITSTYIYLDSLAEAQELVEAAADRWAEDTAGGAA